MAYIVPKGETIYAKRTGVKVYTSPNLNAPLSLSNSKYAHEQREYLAGDRIGVIVDDRIYPSEDGTKFLKVQNGIWVFMSTGLFGITGENIFEPHLNYVAVDDEPGSWVRESWKADDAELTEKARMAEEIETALKNFPKVPAPTAITKYTNAKGEDAWRLTFPNGYEADYNEFIDLSPETKITLTTRKNGLKSGLIEEDQTGGDTPKNEESSTLLTRTNLLIGAGVLGLFTVLIVLLLRKK